MSSLDATLNDLHDQLEALQRTILGLERGFRALAECDDLSVDDFGDEMTPGECIARIAAALAALRRSINDAETRRSEAKESAARLSIGP